MFTRETNRYPEIQFFETAEEMREFQRAKKLMLDEGQFLPDSVKFGKEPDKHGDPRIWTRYIRINLYDKYVFFLEEEEAKREFGVDPENG